MRTTDFKKCLLAAIATVSLVLIATAPVRALAADTENDDAVFLDGGDGDFDAVPIVPEAKPEKKTGKQKVAKTAPAKKQAKPAPAEEPAASEEADDMNVAETEADPLAEKINKDLPAATDPTVGHAKAKHVKTAAAHASKGGHFATTKENCPMMREPASKGEPMVVVKSAKKIWVEDVDSSWLKGFNKAGEPGYISRNCMN